LKRLNPKNAVPVERLQKYLADLAEELGFVSVTAMRREAADGDAVQFNFDCSPISDRDVCPVPFFGSFASGRYRIVCLWDRPSIDVILNRVGTTIKGRPALVLYFGRMTERSRRALAQEARRKRQSFLLIDETLVTFLTAEPGSRLPSMFACCLPFTWSDPYVTTASIVPAELFYGRRDELRKVVDPRGACFVYGGRQLGKTALLRHAERTFSDA